MNILVVGNGFDLAHGLPTSYKDFLEFIKYLNLFYYANKSDISRYRDADKFKELNTDIQTYLVNKFPMNENDILLDELINLSSNNIWIKHFQKRIKDKKLKGENWIDFESEITNVVKSLEYLKKYNDDNLQLTPGNRQYASNSMMYNNGKGFVNDISSRLFEKGTLINKLDFGDIVDSKIDSKDLENHFFCKYNSNKLI